MSCEAPARRTTSVGGSDSRRATLRGGPRTKCFWIFTCHFDSCRLILDFWGVGFPVMVANDIFGYNVSCPDPERGLHIEYHYHNSLVNSLTDNPA